MKRTILCALIVAALGSATLLTASEKMQSEHAFNLKLSRDGFQLLGKVMKDLLLVDIEHEPLADVSTDTQVGATIHAKELELSASFASLKLVPQNAGLKIDIGIRDVAFKAHVIVIESNLLPISVTCRDTTIHIGEDAAAPLKAKTKVELKDGNIAMTLEDKSFTIAMDNYRIEGPASCDGPIGTGVLTKPMIQALLFAARPLIENRIENQVEDMVPGIEGLLNALSHQKVPLDIKDMPPLPDMHLSLQLQPTKLHMTNDGLDLILGAAFSREEPTPEQSFAKKIRPEVRILGELGINPELINELLAIVGEGFQEYFEIDPKAVPGVDQLFDRDRLSGVLPDLKNPHITSSRIRVFIKLASTPFLYLDEAAQDLRMQIPKLQTKFMVQLDGVWQDYFHFELMVDGGAHATIADQHINLGISKNYKFALTGHWDESYTPSINFYDHELADILIITVFDYLYASNPAVRIASPETELYDEKITLGEIKLKDPFISISLVGEPIASRTASK
jgi:hypothetical protein